MMLNEVVFKLVSVRVISIFREKQMNICRVHKIKEDIVYLGLVGLTESGC